MPLKAPHSLHSNCVVSHGALGYRGKASFAHPGHYWCKSPIHRKTTVTGREIPGQSSQCSSPGLTHMHVGARCGLHRRVVLVAQRQLSFALLTRTRLNPAQPLWPPAAIVLLRVEIPGTRVGR